jgi:CheY-like chemotaxis protein
VSARAVPVIPMISVLLIDDETDHLATAKRHLEGTGTFAVDTCPSAHEALTHLSMKNTMP